MNYVIEFEPDPDPEFDETYEQDGVKVVVDVKSAKFLRGSTLDLQHEEPPRRHAGLREPERRALLRLRHQLHRQMTPFDGREFPDPTRSFFEILGVGPGASDDELNAAISGAVAQVPPRPVRNRR